MSEARILRAWTEGRGGSGPDRATAILAAAVPGVPRVDLEAWSLGDRDRRLLDVRVATFGARVEAVGDCPSCGEQLEVVFDATHLATEDGGRNPNGSVRQEILVADGPDRFRIVLRPPTTADLSAAARTGDVEDARRLLVERCLLEAERDGSPVAASELPDPVIEEMGRAVASIDPWAELRLGVTCPECGEGWEASFDIAAFLWEEIGRRARRLLGEIHALAGAYGWSEAEILALPESRRAAYLELVLA